MQLADLCSRQAKKLDRINPFTEKYNKVFVGNPA